MIERAKQKWDLQLSTSFFGTCQVTNWTGLEGLRNVWFFHREPHLTSTSAVTETTALKVKQSVVKLIYRVMDTSEIITTRQHCVFSKVGLRI